MKSKPVTLITLIIIPMLFLLLTLTVQGNAQNGNGSAPPNEQVQPAQETPAQPAQETPAETKKSETEAATTKLLADTHKAAGVSCTDCHKETPPSAEPATSVCMTCHADYAEKASSAIDPHNAHMSYTNCGDCHHGHKASENQCQSCHSFNLKTP